MRYYFSPVFARGITYFRFCCRLSFELCFVVIIGSAVNAKEDKTIPRRVLILDFVNQQKNSNADYLSLSIAEALIDPLNRTGKFEILPRTLAQKILRERNMTLAETFNEDSALEIGIAADADVVVIGNFIAIEPVVQISAKAVDVGEKRLAVSKSRTAKLDSTIFDSINIVAADMTQEMSEKLPPLAQRVIVKEVGAREFFVHAPLAHAFFLSPIVWGAEKKYISSGYGAGADISFQLLHRYVQPYFSTNFLIANGVERLSSMSFFGFDGGLSFNFAFGTNLITYLKAIEIRPILGSGFQTGTIRAAYHINFLVTTFFGGIIGDFYVHEQFSVAVAIKQHILFESETSLKVFTMQVGMGYRL